jgi:hypothetical protein
MKRVQLVFPNAADVWNYIVATKITNVDVEQETVSGLFTQPQMDLACINFRAAVKEVPTLGINDGQPMELTGKSGTTYKGVIYHRGQRPAHLPAHAIICLTNSVYAMGTWHHAVVNVFGTRQAVQELERFRQRSDLSHIIVIPAGKNEGRVVDDLIRQHLHH